MTHCPLRRLTLASVLYDTLNFFLFGQTLIFLKGSIHLINQISRLLHILFIKPILIEALIISFKIILQFLIKTLILWFVLSVLFSGSSRI